MSPILCISDFELQCKYLEKFNSNRATKNRRVFLHVWNCRSTVHHPPFLRLESYRSAAKFLGARTHRDAMKRCINMPFIDAERREI